jgi:hypothetical protein
LTVVFEFLANTVRDEREQVVLDQGARVIKVARCRFARFARDDPLFVMPE